tara:strand:- start:5861 stop:6367 length:507 start_codon:yes stop_codon:yes gene_type:complete
MSEQNTHWRTFHETEFLGAFDLTEQGVEEKILTITSAVSKTVKDEKGKNETILSCSFQEEKKPMILNATNCKAIQKVSGSPYINKWTGVRVTIYIKKGIKAFGKVVDGLRIKETAPRVQVTEKDLDDAIALLNKATTLDELKTAYKSCKYGKYPKVMGATEKLKKELK